MRVAAEARLGRRVPLHRRALAVAALFLRPAGDADRVAHVLDPGGSRSDLADFLALVEERGIARGEQQRRDDPCDLGVVHAVAVAIPAADLVVVVEYQQWLPAVQLGLRLTQQAAE